MPTPFSEILARMSREQRARIDERAKSLREDDARRKAAYVDEEAAAEYIEMGLVHLRETRLAGALPGRLHKRVGRTVLYRVGDLDAFVDAYGCVHERDSRSVEQGDLEHRGNVHAAETHHVQAVRRTPLHDRGGMRAEKTVSGIAATVTEGEWRYGKSNRQRKTGAESVAATRSILWPMDQELTRFALLGLEAEINKLETRLAELRQQRSQLQGTGSRKPSKTPATAAPAKRSRPVMSDEGRERIRQAQKERWARVRAAQGVTAPTPDPEVADESLASAKSATRTRKGARSGGRKK